MQKMEYHKYLNPKFTDILTPLAEILGVKRVAHDIRIDAPNVFFFLKFFINRNNK